MIEVGNGLLSTIEWTEEKYRLREKANDWTSRNNVSYYFSDKNKSGIIEWFLVGTNEKKCYKSFNSFFWCRFGFNYAKFWEIKKEEILTYQHLFFFYEHLWNPYGGGGSRTRVQTYCYLKIYAHSRLIWRFALQLAERQAVCIASLMISSLVYRRKNNAYPTYVRTLIRAHGRCREDLR